MRCALYARISEDRDGTALGVTRQIEDCRAYAERRGWTVTAEYIDNDISASNGKTRPAYARLLRDIENGSVDAIVVWALDRLHRRPVELEAFIDLADRHKVALGSVGGDVDLATSGGRLHARMMGVVARHEVEQRSERVRRAALQRAERGGYHGGARAYGYSPDGRHLVPDEAAEVVKLYDDFLAGVPLGALTRGLNERGTPTARGGTWKPNTVRGLLLRARNAGLREHKGEIISKGDWPSIVSESTWQAAVALATDPSRRTATGNRANHLLTGLATCGVCGSRRISHGRTRRSTEVAWRHIYRCRECNRLGRRQDQTDELVEKVIVARLSQLNASDLLIPDSRPNPEEDRREAQALRTRLDEVAAAHADGVITISQLRTSTERIKARLAELEAAHIPDSRTAVLGDLINADDVQAAWDALTLDRKRAVVASLIDITLHPGGAGKREFDPSRVEITWKV
jgi:site-specific DNA recombinase